MDISNQVSPCHSSIQRYYVEQWAGTNICALSLIAPGMNCMMATNHYLWAIYNYSNTDQPFIYQDRVFGLDTDCVTGKALTEHLLPSFKIVSVPSRANYWAQVRQTYSETKMPSAPTRKEVEWSENDEEKLLYLIGETS